MKTIQMNALHEINGGLDPCSPGGGFAIGVVGGLASVAMGVALGPIGAVATSALIGWATSSACN